MMIQNPHVNSSNYRCKPGACKCVCVLAHKYFGYALLLHLNQPKHVGRQLRPDPVCNRAFVKARCSKRRPGQ